MKVGIVTFHFVNNFGGALQAYALWRTAGEKLNNISVFINYQNWFIRLTDTIRLFPVTTDWEEIIAGWKTMRLRSARLRRFGAFIKSRCRITKRYGTGWSVRWNPPQCDAYICGSDQIWNPYLTCGLAGVYFLNFAGRNARKISYAASFGINRLSMFQSAKISRYLREFTGISVREKSGQRLIKAAAKREAVRLIDPVFLLRDWEWNEIASAPVQIMDGYILLYIMQRNKAAYQAAEKIKEELKMPLVEISRYGKQPDFVDVSLIDVGPEEFIWLFQNAGFVCTNSYHGLAFSLIFQKDFYLIPCKRFSTRIMELMELLHIDMPCALEGAAVSYDKELVRNILEDEREKALCYLEKYIGEKDEGKHK